LNWLIIIIYFVYFLSGGYYRERFEPRKPRPSSDVFPNSGTFHYGEGSYSMCYLFIKGLLPFLN